MADAAEIVRINPASDGHQSLWPHAGLRPEDPITYRIKLATKWMQERGEALPGKKYCLDRLPDGYALFGKTRQATPEHVDRYLYGHPTYKFRSSEEFYPHFISLMENGTSADCKCIACSKGTRKRAESGSRRQRPRRLQSAQGALQSDQDGLSSEPRREVPPYSSARGRSQVSSWIPQRPPTPPQDMIDDEGTPDVFRQLTDRLRDLKVLEEPITQSKSFDWIIHHKATGSLLKSMTDAPPSRPRQGELVLFTRDQASQLWEAGVLTDTPDEPAGFTDASRQLPTKYSLNYSGFRIEPMGPLGSKDKHWCKRPVTVPITSIRPFMLYRELLESSKPKDYHPTVQHALTAMSSLCIVRPSYFKGSWPSATVFCRGLFIGAELLLVGETVRLVPSAHQDTSQVWDVLRITSIKLKMFHLCAHENAEYEDPTVDSVDQIRHHDCCLHIDGVAFTRDRNRAWSTEKVPKHAEANTLPPAMQGYGPWYPLHDPTRRWKVPFSRILGRCFDKSEVATWLKASISESMRNENGHNHGISIGLEGMIGARALSSRQDPRLANDSEKTWFWADHRIEQLDLHEVKGQVVTDHVHGQPVRDIRAWKRAMTIRNRGAGHQPKYVQAPRRGRPPKAGGSMLAASAVGGALDEGLGTTTVDEDDDDVTSASTSGEYASAEEEQPPADDLMELQSASSEDDNTFSDDGPPVTNLDSWVR